MAIFAGVDEEGVFTFYGIPDGELARYELKSKPLTDESATGCSGRGTG